MKIFAVGMNYAQHNKELTTALLQQNVAADCPPVIFTKADSALIHGGKPFFVPDHMGRIDYEAEVVVRLCRLGRGIDERFAHRYYDAATVGIDFTARDLQRRLRADGLPWELAKGFDGSAAIGQWIPISELPPVQTLDFTLDINGQRRQTGNTAHMLHTIDSLVAYISQYFTIRTGDLLYTGTPVGVGPVAIGDHFVGTLHNTTVLDFHAR